MLFRNHFSAGQLVKAYLLTLKESIKICVWSRGAAVAHLARILRMKVLEYKDGGKIEPSFHQRNPSLMNKTIVNEYLATKALLLGVCYNWHIRPFILRRSRALSQPEVIKQQHTTMNDLSVNPGQIFELCGRCSFKGTIKYEGLTPYKTIS